MPKSAESVLESARETFDDVVEKVRDLTPEAKPKKRRRSLPMLLIVAIGLGALAWFVMRRRGEAESEIAPDVFGNAVEEQRAAKTETAATMRP